MVWVPPFETHGAADAPALLLIAPLGRDRASWGMQLPAFSADFRCIAYDARGTGADTASVAQPSIAAMAADAVALLDALGLERAHVAGWSMGAAVATVIALETPGRVRSLSLYTPWGRTDRWLSLGFRLLADVARHGTPADFEAAVSWLILSRDLITSMDDFDAAVAATAAAPGYPDAATLLAQLQASIEHDRLEAAAAIASPTLLVAGERDQLVPPAYARELAARIPSARLEVLAGAGSTHALLVELAAEFNDLALAFLREVERAL